MAGVTDFIKGVVGDVLADLLKKATGTGKRVRRRKRAPTATERLEKIEKLVRPARKTAAPAKKQTSRKRTVRTRAKTKQRAS